MVNSFLHIISCANYLGSMSSRSATTYATTAHSAEQRFMSPGSWTVMVSPSLWWNQKYRLFSTWRLAPEWQRKGRVKYNMTNMIIYQTVPGIWERYLTVTVISKHTSVLHWLGQIRAKLKTTKGTLLLLYVKASFCINLKQRQQLTRYPCLHPQCDIRPFCAPLQFSCINGGQ